MLVLSRRPGEEIIINGNIRVTVVSVKGDRVRLGIEAPASVPVRRVARAFHRAGAGQSGERLPGLTRPLGYSARRFVA